MIFIKVLVSFLSTLYFSNSAYCTPLIEINNFDDNWNYEITPHKQPLLDAEPKDHLLPPTSQIQRDMKNRNMETRMGKKLGNSVRSRVPCSVCKLGAGLLLKNIRQGISFVDIRMKFINICVSFKIEREPICAGVFDVFGPVVIPAFNSSKIGISEICGLILGESCGDIDNPLHEWQVEFPKKVKPELHNFEIPKPGSPIFKVLHISDTHYDPEYAEGSPANCLEPLCCRSYSSPPENNVPVISAGKWGTNSKCDVPKELIDNMLEHITQQHPDIDYIIWTGDLPPHDIWNQTKKKNLNNLHNTVQQVLKAFPNIPIFPALGNHESIPAGTFAPPWIKTGNFSIDYLYNDVASEWTKFLPNSVNNTILHGGFYSVLLRPGFRLISLNTNYCHSINWWLLVNSTDPAKELKWLIHELQKAEDNNEKVHIIGHIAPGSSDCLKVWSRNFYSIVDRYEDTITAQFYGHSHADEFKVFYDIQDYNRPTGIAYLGPSVTTYEHYNPAYRIYYVDGDHADTTREVIDHETWTTNIEEANENDKPPNWYRLYSAKKDFQMNSLRPSEWNELIYRMIDDAELYESFLRYYYRNNSKRPICNENECKLQLLCDLKSGKSNDRHHLCFDLELAFGS